MQSTTHSIARTLCRLFLLALPLVLSAAAIAESNRFYPTYFYAANVCQREILAMRIESDGLLSPIFNSASIAHDLIASKQALYVSNAGWNNSMLAARVESSGQLTQLNRLNGLNGFSSGIAIHPRGVALYRATSFDLATHGMLFDECLVQIMTDGMPGLSSFPINRDGSLRSQTFHFTQQAPTSLAVSLDGRFLFAGRSGMMRGIDVYRLNHDGQIEFPALHSLSHFAPSVLMTTVRVGNQDFLLSSEGEAGVIVFKINNDGSLEERSLNLSEGRYPKAFATLTVAQGVVNVYVANYGHYQEQGNNVAVFRVTANGDLISLQVVAMPEEKGDPLYRRPSGLIATPSHLYVTNFGRSLNGSIQEGSVLVFPLNSSGLLVTPHVQEVSAAGNGTASPVMVPARALVLDH